VRRYRRQTALSPVSPTGADHDEPRSLLVDVLDERPHDRPVPLDCDGVCVKSSLARERGALLGLRLRLLALVRELLPAGTAIVA
jgi:hypothetical protein